MSIKEVAAFLLGEGPLDGVWFGDPHPHGNRYWWRKHLRDALAEAPKSNPMQCEHCGIQFADKQPGSLCPKCYREVTKAEAPKAEPDGWVVGTHPPWIKPRAFGSLEEAEAWCDRYDVPKHKDGMIRPFKFIDDMAVLARGRKG